MLVRGPGHLVVLELKGGPHTVSVAGESPGAVLELELHRGGAVLLPKHAGVVAVNDADVSPRRLPTPTTKPNIGMQPRTQASVPG